MATFDRINLKWLSLILLVFQTTATILVTRYSRSLKSSADGLTYLSSTAVLMSEILKVAICLLVVYFDQAKQSFRRLKLLMNEQILNSPTEMAKILVPAVLYTLQNNLIFLALTNLNAALYQVTYQLKLFTTAFFSVVMLGRRLEIQKWFSLGLLMIGVILVQLKPNDNQLLNKSAKTPDLITHSQKHSSIHQNTAVGLIAVLSACLCSGFSGVYFEKLLKHSSSGITLWMRNIQLGLWGVLFGFLGALMYDWSKIMANGFFQGYTFYTWIVIILQALGGLIIAVVIKYADNIVKGFANAISISLSALLSHFLLHDFEPNRLFALGTFVVVLATFFYGYSPKNSNSKANLKAKTSEKVILLTRQGSLTPQENQPFIINNSNSKENFMKQNNFNGNKKTILHNQTFIT